MALDDLPKMWVEPIDEDEIELESPSELIILEEPEVKLPTIAEQQAAVEISNIQDSSKSMLKSLIETNHVAQLLSQIHLEESAEMRKGVLNMWCESFIGARMQNNAQAETLKMALLNRLLKNVDNLDLETTARIYNDLTDVSNVDAQQAMSAINGGGMVSPGGGGGINLTINNATAEGSAITNNTLNAGQQAPAQGLKEIDNLAGSIKGWGNAPRITTTTKTVEGS